MRLCSESTLQFSIKLRKLLQLKAWASFLSAVCDSSITRSLTLLHTLQAEPKAVLVQAQAKYCCSQDYPELEKLPCDLDHYCNYVDWDEYSRVQTGGIVVAIIMLVVMVSIILTN